MRLRVLVGLFSGLVLLVGRGSAASISISNSSFENTSCGVVGPVVCTATGWTAIGDAAAFLPASSAWDSIPDGQQVGFSNGNGATLTQVLAENITPDTIYTLSVWVSQRWTAGSFLPQIQLLGGNTALLTMNNSNPGGAAPIMLQDGTYSWVDWTMSWTSPSSGATIGQALQISLGSDNVQTDFDNVTLTSSPDFSDSSAVPEPAVFGLVGAGLIGLIGRRRFTK